MLLFVKDLPTIRPGADCSFGSQATGGRKIFTLPFVRLVVQREIGHWPVGALAFVQGQAPVENERASILGFEPVAAKPLWSLENRKGHGDREVEKWPQR